MTDIDLDAIEARAAAATEGPWEALAKNGALAVVNAKIKFFVVAMFHPDDRTAPGPENAQFIAHARTDIPALVSRVRELEAREVRVRALHTAGPANCGVEICAECDQPLPLAALDGSETP